MIRLSTFFVSVALAAAVAMPTAPRAQDAEFSADSSLRNTRDVNQSLFQSLRARNIWELMYRVTVGAIERDVTPPQGASSAGGVLLAQGSAAGGDAIPVSLWADVSYSSFDDDHPTTRFDGNTTAIFLGADFFLWDSLVVGLSVGGDDTDTDSGLNASSTDSDGFTVAPYFVYVINQNYSADFSAGFTGTDNDQTRQAGGAIITSDSDTSTTFFTLNGNASYWIDLWNLSGRVGYRRSVARTDSYIESNGIFVPDNETTLGTFLAGGRVRYFWAPNNSFVDSVLPYFSFTVEHDHVRDESEVGPGQLAPPDDRTGVVLGGGVTVNFADNFTGGFSINGTLGREDTSHMTVSGTLSWSFP